jgi:hydroxyethylthiazole kinase
MNTTANALLAIGASPIMAHAIEEVEEIVGISKSAGGALVINIGTLSEKWIASMSKAMKAAKNQGVPIIFDPVGAGASKWRTETCKQLVAESNPTVIRGNASEIMALIDAGIRTKGVDSSESSDSATQSAKSLAAKLNTTVCVSGETDVITDGTQVMTVKNGDPLMPKVTGLGCTATALIGAFAAVNPNPLYAATHAMAVMGIAGEIAAEKAAGPGTLQLYFYDALFKLDKDQIETFLK